MPKIIRVTTSPQTARAFLIHQINTAQLNGYDMIMVSGEGEEDWAKFCAQTSVRHAIIPMSRGINLIHDFRALFAFIRFFLKEKPDIVHTMTPKAGLLGMLAAFVCRVPIRLHDVVGMVQQSKKGLLFYILDMMERITYSCAHQITPNSFSLKDYILSRKMATPSKVVVNGKGSSHGVDLNVFSAQKLNESTLENVKARIGYQSDLKYILAVGRMVGDKGINELVAGFEAINSKFPETRLLLVGPLEEDLDKLDDKTIETIKNNNKITHILFSTQIEYFMHLATLLVHASHREGLPNVLLEAGAMNLPIVCAAATGNVDVVQHQETGLLFSIENQADLENKVIFALNDTATMQQYASNLYTNIERYFSNTQVNKYVMDMYHERISARASK